MQNHFLRRARRSPVLLGAMLALAACGDNSSPDKSAPTVSGFAKPATAAAVPDQHMSAALNAYYTQAVNWGDCVLGSATARDILDGNRAIASRTQCADITVPRDYAAPSDGDIKVAVLRVASDQVLRHGAPRQSLFFNPGGPGGDGREDMPLNFARYIAAANENPDSRIGDLARLGEFDLVGFSPRGLGASTELVCNAPPESGGISVSDNIESELRRVTERAQSHADGCAANPLTRHINTESTARDMDLIRALVGAEKLNYVGASYGTWLGAWYAGLFPGHTGRMVLDSVMNFTSDFDWAVSQIIPAEGRAISHYLAPMFERHRQKQGYLQAIPRLDAIFETLDVSLQRAVASMMGRQISGSLDALDGIATLLGAHALNVGITAEDAANLTQIALLNQKIVKAMGVLSLTRLSLYEKTVVESDLGWTPAQVMTNRAVRCNDMTAERDLRRVFDRIQHTWGGQPVARVYAFGNFCAQWPFKPAFKKPGFDALSKAGPMLLVQSEFDTMTPLAGAQATLNALPGSRLLTVENYAKHGLLPSAWSCINKPVVDFLVEGKLPEENIRCLATDVL
jgi:pimeloyl-ACP methyl ester carboxylesterase